MTEISSVGGDAFVPEVIEVQLHETFDTLHDKAQEAITNSDFDKAIELLVELDKTPIDSRNQANKFIDLVISLWRKDAFQGDRLIDLMTNHYTFYLDENLIRYKEVGGGSSGSFSIQRRPSSEGLKHLEKLSSLFSKKEYEKFEEELKKAFQLLETRDVTENALTDVFYMLSLNNIVALEKFFPMISEFFQVRLEGSALWFIGKHWTHHSISDRYLLKDYNYALEAIAKEEDSEERMELIFTSATMHESMRAELLKMAHEAFETAETEDEKFSIAIQLADFYLMERLAEPLKQIIAEAELLIQDQEKLDKLMLIAYHRVEASLVEKNQADFDKHLSFMKTHLPKLSDPDEKEAFEEDIQYLESEGNKLFGVDSLSMQAERV